MQDSYKNEYLVLFTVYMVKKAFLKILIELVNGDQRGFLKQIDLVI